MARVKWVRNSRNSAFRDLKKKLSEMPLSMAHDVAQASAPSLTRLTRTAYAAGKKVYGEPRPLGEGGKPLSLWKSGLTQRTLRFVASGTIVRCVLAKEYMRYLIGKYKVLPNNALPAEWDRELDRIQAAVKVDL